MQTKDDTEGRQGTGTIVGDRSRHESNTAARQSERPSEGDGPGEHRSGQPEQEPVGTAAFARRAEETSSEQPQAGLLKHDQASDLRERWTRCQQQFVDEPRDSVKSADELVAEVMEKVASEFASTRQSLEKQWDKGDLVSTEDLRIAMQRYREFFNRLLAA